MVTQNTFGTNSGPNVSISQQTTANVSLVPTTPVPTFAQLPGPTTVPPGTIEYTSDQGPVYSNGSSWQYITAGTTIPVAPSGDTTGVLDIKNLQAATNTLSINGGGRIYLAQGQFYWNAAYLPKNGVQVIGVEPVLSYPGLSDDNSVTPVAGTIINAVGSIAAMQWNKTNPGVPASSRVFLSGALTNAGLQSVGFKGFTRAVDGGFTNSMAAAYCTFRNIYAFQCSDWGFYLINYQHCDISRIFSFGATNGQIYFGNDVPVTIDAPGNVVMTDIMAVIPSNTSRGLVFECVNGIMDEILVNRAQAWGNPTVNPVTQAATMSAGAGVNITVTDGTKFAVKMPVTFSSSVNGFTASKIYFVTSVASNVIQVANTIGGSAVAANSNSAVNVITYGMAPLEIVAYAGQNINGVHINNLDAESSGTTGVIFQNVANSELHISALPQAAGGSPQQCVQHVTQRGTSNVLIVSPQPCTMDIDVASVNPQLVGVYGYGSVGSLPTGMFEVVTAQNGSTTDFTVSFNAGLQLRYFTQIGNGGCLLPVTTGIGDVANTFNSTFTLSANQCGTVVYLITGAQSVTLPAVNSPQLGIRFNIVNDSRSTGNLTVNTNTVNSAQQKYNGVSGRTSIILAPGAGFSITASPSYGNENIWAVTGMAGVYNAGTQTIATI